MNANIELYGKEIEVLNRIDELKKLGYEESEMYIITDDDNAVSMLKGRTEVIIKEDDDSLWDRFKSFLSGDDSVLDAFNRMNLEEEDKDFYYEQIKSGKILLYVDKEYIQYYNLDEDGRFRPIVDPNIPYTPDKEDKRVLDGEKILDKKQREARGKLLIEEKRDGLK